MKCRNIVKNTNGKQTIVWFGSIGLDEHNNAIKAQNYVDKQQGVASSLIQRLSIIKGELWYNIQEGLPLFDKGITITSMDAYVIRTIMNQPDVINIASFSSKVEDHAYHCNVDVISKYGTFSLTV